MSASTSAQQAARLPGRLTAAPRVAAFLGAEGQLGAAVWTKEDGDRIILVPGDAPTAIVVWPGELPLQAADAFLRGERYREIPFPEL